MLVALLFTGCGFIASQSKGVYEQHEPGSPVWIIFITITLVAGFLFAARVLLPLVAVCAVLYFLLHAWDTADESRAMQARKTAERQAAAEAIAALDERTLRDGARAHIAGSRFTPKHVQSAIYIGKLTPDDMLLIKRQSGASPAQVQLTVSSPELSVQSPPLGTMMDAGQWGGSGMTWTVNDDAVLKVRYVLPDLQNGLAVNGYLRVIANASVTYDITIVCSRERPSGPDCSRRLQLR